MSWRSDLPVPVTDAGRAGLAAILEDPAGALLAVDYDGVLAPIVADPENAPPQPGAVAALARLAGLLGSAAVISGRPAQVVVDYCQFTAGQATADQATADQATADQATADQATAGRSTEQPGPPDLVVFGLYGQQRWDARTGKLTSPPPPPELAAVRRELPALLDRVGVTDAWIEDKTVAVAVHTRRSADPAVALATLTPAVTECAQRHGLAVEPGRFVLEVRAPGIDKGATLRSYAEERGARAVCYIGDDLGDLPAFDAVEALRRKGVSGVTVASGSHEVAAVAGRADLVVDGPPGVVALLTSLAAALRF